MLCLDSLSQLSVLGFQLSNAPLVLSTHGSDRGTQLFDKLFRAVRGSLGCFASSGRTGGRLCDLGHLRLGHRCLGAAFEPAAPSVGR